MHLHKHTQRQGMFFVRFHFQIYWNNQTASTPKLFLLRRWRQYIPSERWYSHTIVQDVILQRITVTSTLKLEAIHSSETLVFAEQTTHTVTRHILRRTVCAAMREQSSRTLSGRTEGFKRLQQPFPNSRILTNQSAIYFRNCTLSLGRAPPPVWEMVTDLGTYLQRRLRHGSKNPKYLQRIEHVLSKPQPDDSHTVLFCFWGNQDKCRTNHKRRGSAVLRRTNVSSDSVNSKFKKKKLSQPCNRTWRLMGLWDVEDLNQSYSTDVSWNHRALQAWKKHLQKKTQWL
jgi:hypothetical protein